MSSRTGCHTYTVCVNKNLVRGDQEVVPTRIPITRLDSYVERRGLKTVSLVKIDAEFHEAEVLKGMEAMISEFKPVLLIEILTDASRTRLQAMLDGRGYVYYGIDERGAPRLLDGLTDVGGRNYLICLPSIARQLGLASDSEAS